MGLLSVVDITGEEVEQSSLLRGDAKNVRLFFLSADLIRTLLTIWGVKVLYEYCGTTHSWAAPQRHSRRHRSS